MSETYDDELRAAGGDPDFVRALERGDHLTDDFLRDACPVSPPSIEPIEVTDAMVEAALVAWYDDPKWAMPQTAVTAMEWANCMRDDMRAAIIAALAVRG